MMPNMIVGKLMGQNTKEGQCSLQICSFVDCEKKKEKKYNVQI
jgi:hypothetical protein